jgi:uncharacterized protein YcbK (DUF882 family)
MTISFRRNLFPRIFAATIVLVGILFSHLLKATPQPQLLGNAGKAYRLQLYHTHTKERLDIVYRVGSAYLPGATDELDHFLRDHRTGDVYLLDPRLFDLLHDLSAAVGRSEGEIDIVCGYRSQMSNEFLRRTTVGVAQHSRHMLGEAIDIRIPGVSTSRLRDAALGLHRGGVGYYPQSQFVHVDVGPVRRWQMPTTAGG